MDMNQIVMWLMGICALIGGLDRITGCHLKLGDAFDEGFHALGELALGMTGMLCLAPVIADLLAPALSPVFRALGMDPSVIATLIANDMGGYSLAMELCDTPEAGLFSGVFVASMLGCTLVFTIPVAFHILAEEDKPYFSYGLLLGILTIPVGSLLGGLLAGFSLDVILPNSVFLILLSVLLALALWRAPDGTIRCCLAAGKLITALTYIGLTAAAFGYLTGVTLIPGMMPVMDAMAVVAACGVTLLGTFPLLRILTRLLRKPLGKLSLLMGVDTESTDGLVYSLANSVPVYKMMGHMGKKGIVLNTAWLVCATAALGDHLAFTSSVQPGYLLPLIAGKLLGGLLGVLLALRFPGPAGNTGSCPTLKSPGQTSGGWSPEAPSGRP